MPPEITQEELDALKAKAGEADKNSKTLEDLKKENDELKKKGDKKTEEGKVTEDLNDKVRREQEERNRRDGESKDLESALTFSLSKDKFLEENKDVLPEEMSQIFVAAEKESYSSAIDKSNAMKDAIIKSFFRVQDNLDLTTDSHKRQIESYLKLTHEGRKEKANDVYQNIFEPTLRALKQIKKAEQANLANKGINTDVTDSNKKYLNRMIESSKKYYLKEK